MKKTVMKFGFSLRGYLTAQTLLLRLLAPIAFVASSAMPTHAEINLVFGTYAADKPTETVKKYKPFLNYMAAGMTEILGEKVVIRMKIAKDYELGITHLANGNVDFARFGPASYVTVHELENGVRILAMESKQGRKRFKGIIAVRSDDKIQSLEQLAQGSFAFGDQLSTIGRYLAQSHLIAAGVTSHHLSGYEYLGRHDRVGTAVGAGRFTAGALKESTFKKLVKSGVPIRALFEFENVTKPWIASAEMKPEVFAAMQQVMLATSDPEILQSISKDGFVEGSDKDYDFIREAMKHSQNF